MFLGVILNNTNTKNKNANSCEIMIYLSIKFLPKKLYDKHTKEKRKKVLATFSWQIEFIALLHKTTKKYINEIADYSLPPSLSNMSK